jgi:hypothetical protein
MPSCAPETLACMVWLSPWEAQSLSDNDDAVTESDTEDECVIPVPLPKSELNKFVSAQPEHEARAIFEYLEAQAPDENVVHLEKITTEYLPGRSLDAWDVHTSSDRYWVITNPTNLYSQQAFPSLDYTFTFHVGLTARIMAREARSAPDEHRVRLMEAWRQWEQASLELDRCEEAEDFQAIGMRCRECLISFIRAVADQAMVPPGREAPKGANFNEWSDLIADAIARGSSAEETRVYLKAVAGSTMKLVHKLTHATTATRSDGAMAVNATQNVLAAFGTALERYESHAPDRCPQCSSYQLVADYRPELELDPPYVSLCVRCGWSTPEPQDG